ncbi:hypothetical protein C8Q77DRAFT_1045389, partial [Trametes polyzona]
MTPSYPSSPSPRWPQLLSQLPDLSCALRLSLLALFLSCCAPASIAARGVNITIDNELGDSTTGAKPTYSPDATWALSPTSSNAVDARRAFGGTWHASTYDPDKDGQPHTVTASFTGSAVYVFYILANTTVNLDTEAASMDAIVRPARLTFLLDDDLVGSFEHTPLGNVDVQYNVPVYTNTSVPQGLHTLRIETTGPATPSVLFDYIIYT